MSHIPFFKKSIIGAVIMFSCVQQACASENPAPAIEPQRVEPKELVSTEVKTRLPDWPAEMVVSGESGHGFEMLHSGEIDVSIYESKPIKLRIDNFPQDEYVVILSGRLILEADGGEPETYEVGDSVIVPKGFNGTWEMQGEFRELAVMVTKTPKE